MQIEINIDDIKTIDLVDELAKRVRRGMLEHCPISSITEANSYQANYYALYIALMQYEDNLS